MAVTYGYIGKNQQALNAHKRASEHFARNNQREASLRSQINSSWILLRLGHYAQAIRLIRSAMATEWYPASARGERLLAEKALLLCYLGVGKYEQATAIADKIQQSFEEYGNHLTLLEVLTFQAVAQAELRLFDTALATIEHAYRLSQELDSRYWRGELHRLRSRVFLLQNKTELALQEAQNAGEFLQSEQNRFETCSLGLVQARCFARLEQYAKAFPTIEAVMQVAQEERFLSIQSDAYLLQADIHEHLGEVQEAIQNYAHAAAIVEYALQTLTLTLRTDFLAHNGEAHQALATHYLQEDQAGAALAAIEKLKAHAHLRYLIHQEQLRWGQDARTQAQWEELDRLREAYHEQDTAQPGERNPKKLTAIAKQIESLREHLYLTAEQDAQATGHIPTLADIQNTLGQDELMVAYYETPDLFYAILMTCSREWCIPLGPTATCQRLIAQCYLNFNAVLQSSLQNINLATYTKMAQTILQRLYDVLIRPFQEQLEGVSRLWIVPYGSLHQVPFGCLYHDGRYLIQDMEIALLPYSGHLTLHNMPTFGDESTILSHSFEQRVAARLDEGEMVASHFGSVSYQENDATCERVYQAQGKLLHIAAHAHFHLDYPDLSYIQLGDGRLYVDELFQQRLPVELVVLSACETGQARVAPGDELLGLGRGFLYSGVSALVVSLWQVADVYTYQLMKHFYDALLRIPAPSKSRALQQAQCQMLEKDFDLHPVLWGAFQFIGDPRPLKFI